MFLSSLGSRYMSPQYPLGAMKAAMETLVRQWAEEFADAGVHANAVCAGLVKTDSYKTLRRLWPELAALPESAYVTPEEVADVVAFLSTPASRAICGQTRSRAPSASPVTNSRTNSRSFKSSASLRLRVAASRLRLTASMCARRESPGRLPPPRGGLMREGRDLRRSRRKSGPQGAPDFASARA